MKTIFQPIVLAKAPTTSGREYTNIVNYSHDMTVKSHKDTMPTFTSSRAGVPMPNWYP